MVFHFPGPTKLVDGMKNLCYEDMGGVCIQSIHWIPSKSRLWLYFNVFRKSDLWQDISDAILLFFFCKNRHFLGFKCVSIQNSTWILFFAQLLQCIVGAHSADCQLTELSKSQTRRLCLDHDNSKCISNLTHHLHLYTYTDIQCPFLLVACVVGVQKCQWARCL